MSGAPLVSMASRFFIFVSGTSFARATLLLHSRYNMIYSPPEKRKADDTSVAVREVSETSPITLENADNKILAAVIDAYLSPGIQEWACCSQRCFIFGRNITLNLVEADISSRDLARMSSTLRALLLLCDYGSAFPSLAHAYILQVLTRGGFGVAS